MLSRRNTLEIEVSLKNITDTKIKQIHNYAYLACKECPIANALLDLGVSKECVFVGKDYISLINDNKYSSRISTSKKIRKFIHDFDTKGLAKPTKFVLKF